MRILVVTWDGGGNVPPALELGRRAVEMGHHVDVLGPPGLAGRVAAAGLGFVARQAAREWDPLEMALGARSAIEASDADVVVVDYMLPPVLCAAVAIERPVVALVHTLHATLLVDGAPAPMSMAMTRDGLDLVRFELGLPGVQRLGDVLDEVDAVVVATLPELDSSVRPVVDGVRYVGPILEGPGPDAGWRPPWGTGARDRPAVLVTMGTTPMDEGPVVERVAAGAHAAGAEVLVLLGEHLDPAGLDLPPGVSVSRHVRHAAVLPHVDVVVSHGGLGTVGATLAHGRPMVNVPLGREQPENARAVAHVGAGRVVEPAASVGEVAEVIGDVLATPAVRAAAGRLAEAIASCSRSAPVDAVLEAL
ncbi:glycosyltransferase [Actinomarinicola tropica]|uniref:Uncharacterized protein n=1 Tax=Actinomarinicola tropica TaxID=2789776 RepID=A0A5Q2RDP2_9ACTN|nr:glycosyltransferase [Actinomarinicola tropica]QGG94999.1 hypothetical protein GH723_07705 [Actinomarinicola tropica]